MDLSTLEKNLDFVFKKRELLQTALTHRSYLNEQQAADSYERLEFFGDAILEFIASEYIYEHFVSIREGRLTEIRAALVRTESLAKCAKKINLGPFLKMSKGEAQNNGQNNLNILADSVEALIAAIYLDQGLAAAKKFFERFLAEEVELIVKNKSYIDAKSFFQEYIQDKLKVTPEYRLIKEIKDGNSAVFEIGVFVDNKLVASGKGKNKKSAEHEAALNALSKHQVTVL